MSTGETRTVGDVQANELTWSPNGTTIAYTQAVAGDSTTEVRHHTDRCRQQRSERPLTTESYQTSQGIGVVWSLSQGM